MTIEIFRTGRHVAESGYERDYTAADLEDMAISYDPALHEAPVVIGHPVTNAPAYGWVQGLRLDGDRLLADLTQVDTQFQNLVREGRYKKRSVSLYRPDAPGNPKPGTLYLRHVGFLGAQPPAVKGLRDVAFQASDAAIEIEFSENENWAFSALSDVLRNLREWLISEHDLATADRLIPEYAIAAAAAASAPTESTESTPPSMANAFQENTQEPPVSEQTPDYEAQAAALAAREAALAAREADLAAAETARRRREAADFAEAQVKSGRVLPRQQVGLIEALLAISATTVEFADGDRTVTTGTADWLRQFILDLPPQVDYRERSAPSQDDNPRPPILDRAAFNDLNPTQRKAFFAAGGTVQD